MESKNPLLRYFTRVVILTVDVCEHRREKLSDHLAEVFGEECRPAWPTSPLVRPPAVEWLRAVDGQDSPPPGWWNCNAPNFPGHGAWGCLHSHTRAVQDASGDKLENILVLEDDVCFLPDAAERLDAFMRELPEDWDMLYLGGQHMTHPSLCPDSPGVLRCNNIHRTHAFAVNGRCFHDYLEHIWHAPDYLERQQSHIDHQLGLLHSRGDKNIYCPEWHFAGQGAGPSNISGNNDPERWWHPEFHKRNLPLVIDSNPAKLGGDGPAIGKPLIDRLHFGWNLLPGTLTDEGVTDALATKTATKSFLAMLGREALDLGRCPAISHPMATAENLADFWPVVIPSESLGGDLARLACPC